MSRACGFFFNCSDVECGDEVYSVRQLEARASRLKEPEEEPQQRPPVLPPRKPLADKPVAVTASLFRFQERPKPTAQVQAVQPRPRIEGKENSEDRRQAKVRCFFFFHSLCIGKNSYANENEKETWYCISLSYSIYWFNDRARLASGN